MTDSRNDSDIATLMERTREQGRRLDNIEATARDRADHKSRIAGLEKQLSDLGTKMWGLIAAVLLMLIKAFIEVVGGMK